MAVGPTTDGLHHPALAEVLAAELQAHAVGSDCGAAEQVGLPPRVVPHHMGGRVADDDQLVAGPSGSIDGAPVDVAAGQRDATGDLLLDQLKVSCLHQPGGDAVVGEGLELGVGVGGVAVALHHRQVLVITIGALEGCRVCWPPGAGRSSWRSRCDRAGSAGRNRAAASGARPPGFWGGGWRWPPPGAGCSQQSVRHPTARTWPCTAAPCQPQWYRRGSCRAATQPAPFPSLRHRYLLHR